MHSESFFGIRGCSSSSCYCDLKECEFGKKPCCTYQVGAKSLQTEQKLNAFSTCVNVERMTSLASLTLEMTVVCMVVCLLFFQCGRCLAWVATCITDQCSSMHGDILSSGKLLLGLCAVGL